MNIIETNFKYLKPLIPLDPNKVEFIFIHHPASKTATPEQIHQWHLDKGFNGFGYNEYIRKDGTGYIGRGDNIGAQVSKHNSKSYGICFEGNYDVEEGPSDESYKLIAMRVIQTQKRFPKAQTILPHSARNSTNCPGKNFSMGKLYDAINDLIKEGEKVEEIKTEHWVEESYNKLANDFGIIIHEKRFDDKITRAEVMELLLRGLESIKKYIDSPLRL